MSKPILNASTSLSGTSTNIQKSKAEKTAERIRKLTIDRGNPRFGWSKKEWCAMVGISPNTYYRTPPEDRPLVVTIGGKDIITLAAHQEWEARAMERARAEQEAAKTGCGGTA